MTIRDALRATAARFDQFAVSSPGLNAEVLLAHCLSVDRTYLYTHDEQTLTPEQQRCIDEASAARISGKPLQYIVGRQEFFGREFEVNPSVLIPRPETEHLVERVFELHPRAGSRIVDVGTGSGCIGVTLALELPESQVLLTDVSFDALLTASANAQRLGANVSLACMDLLDAAAGPFDLVVCNPPYVSIDESSRLQREVREHEPHVALFAGNDGLDVYRRLIPSVRKTLRRGGYLLLEIGFSLEEPVLNLFGKDWERLPTERDLQEIPRVVCVRLSA